MPLQTFNGNIIIKMAVSHKQPAPDVVMETLSMVTNNDKRKAVRGKMRNVVDNLELVLGELKTVVGDLQTLVTQIDVVTTHIDQRCSDAVADGKLDVNDMSLPGLVQTVNSHFVDVNRAGLRVGSTSHATRGLVSMVTNKAESLTLVKTSAVASIPRSKSSGSAHVVPRVGKAVIQERIEMEEDCQQQRKKNPSSVIQVPPYRGFTSATPLGTDGNKLRTPHSMAQIQPTGTLDPKSHPKRVRSHRRSKSEGISRCVRNTASPFGIVTPHIFPTITPLHSVDSTSCDRLKHCNNMASSVYKWLPKESISNHYMNIATDDELTTGMVGDMQKKLVASPTGINTRKGDVDNSMLAPITNERLVGNKLKKSRASQVLKQPHGVADHLTTDESQKNQRNQNQRSSNVHCNTSFIRQNHINHNYNCREENMLDKQQVTDSNVQNWMASSVPILNTHFPTDDCLHEIDGFIGRHLSPFRQPDTAVLTQHHGLPCADKADDSIKSFWTKQSFDVSSSSNSQSPIGKEYCGVYEKQLEAMLEEVHMNNTASYCDDDDDDNDDDLDNLPLGIEAHHTRGWLNRTINDSVKNVEEKRSAQIRVRHKKVSGLQRLRGSDGHFTSSADSISDDGDDELSVDEDDGGNPVTSFSTSNPSIKHANNVDKNTFNYSWRTIVDP